jgi:hypothetical protein
MKLVIEIADITNLDACAGALERLYDAIQEHQGHAAAQRLFLWGVSGYPSKYTDEQERQRMQDNIRRAPEDFRLALEYYAMPKPNKERLANDLVRKNETLPKEKCFGPRGTTSPMTMLKQIKRVLKREEYREVATLTPEQRVEALRWAESFSSMTAYMRAAGHPVKRRRPLLKNQLPTATDQLASVKVTRG